jgi:uncharacterized protein YkwD/uncharacterized membrane protein required for colicin V production
MNWLDLAIAVVIFFYIIAGLRRGFLMGLVELTGIIVSIGIPLLLYIPASRILEAFGVSQGYSGAIAFLIIFVFVTSVFYAISTRLYKLIPRLIRSSAINRFLGLFTGLLKGILIVTLLIALLVVLPVPYVSSDHVEESYFGSPLLDIAAEVSSLTARIFGEAFKHALGFLTVETVEGGYVELSFRVTDPVIDPDAEEEMLRLVNEERAQHGLPELVIDETIREVARMHSIDMFQRGYIGHVDPDGVTPFDRMREGGVSFFTAGENLAFAPTVSIAHQGLMDSPGHRENILSPHYSRVGIGVARGGRYGIMFTQKFAD